MNNKETVENSQGALCLDNDWKIIALNNVASEILLTEAGVSSAAVKAGLGLNELASYDAGGKAPSAELVEAALSSRYNLHVVDFCESPDGKTFLCCFVKSKGDLSVKKSADELYRRNKMLTMIGMFSAGLAHDYNNALTAVMGNISLAKFESENNRELSELLRDAEKASLRIKGLTERLIEYSRGIRLNRAKTDISVLACSVFNELMIEYKGHYKFNTEDGIAGAEVDPAMIAMVMECVLRNSMEATVPAEGLIELDISKTDVTEEVRFRELSLVPGSYIRLSVKDNGTGIQPENKENIFDPYFTTKEGHDGIGLSLAYSIIKRHRGYISTEATDTGTIISLFIPLF